MAEIGALIVRPTLGWMGGRYDDARAGAVLLCGGWTESRLLWRDQRDAAGRNGPAFGWWQVEAATLADFLARGPALLGFFRRLSLVPELVDRPELVEFDPIAACCAARVILYERVAQALPPLAGSPAAASEALRQYLAAWRPGSPHPETFVAAWPAAVAVAARLWGEPRAPAP